jgi:hypothetical protein
MLIRAKFIKDGVVHKVAGKVVIPAGEERTLSVASFKRWERRGCVVAIGRVEEPAGNAATAKPTAEAARPAADEEAAAKSADAKDDDKKTPKDGKPG